MTLVRPVIADFAARMFGGFARRDQRAKEELYLRGLMLDGKRKSTQPMADRLGVDHQQFVSTSTWDHVRRRLAVRAGQFVDPDALVIDDTGFPKDGKDTGYGDATEFRLGLTDRDLTSVLAVCPTATAHPAHAAPRTAAWAGNGRPPGPRYPDKPTDLKTLAIAAVAQAVRTRLRRTPQAPVQV